LLSTAAALWGAVALLPAGSAAAEAVLFNRDIRPILSDACFRCHGPDAKAETGGLRLDLRERAVQRADSGRAAIVAGDPASSELVRRIQSDDPDARMPPPDSGKTLTPEQIELLTQWIAQGAEYQGHWAFSRVERPAVPARTALAPASTVQSAPATAPRPAAHSGGDETSLNPIDAFLQDRLRREGLTPAPQADLHTLLRRAALDLTGLPPTPAEVDAFLAELGPEEQSDPQRIDAAYERYVDRLFASPHYGERMAVQWLDFARYADSHGFQTDSSRDMSPWRDWVVDACNRNLPFDQFTVEQLAGDLLPDPSTPQLIATGLHRNHRLNGEGGIIADEWRIENVIDRVETTGLAWLGLTLNCCRCHDHKYDPISQREFYQLFAFFNQVDESGVIVGTPNRNGGNAPPVIDLPTPQHLTRIAELKVAIEERQRQVQALQARLPEFVAAWEADLRSQLAARSAPWQPLVPSSVQSTGGATLTRQPDGSWLASGPNPQHDVYVVEAPAVGERITALLLETLPDSSLPNQSVGRYPNGNYVLSDVRVTVRTPEIKTPENRAEPGVAKLSKVEADYNQKGWEVGLILDGNPGNGWAVDGPTRREPNRAAFVFAAPIATPAGSVVRIELVHAALSQHNIGRFRLSMSSLDPGLVSISGDAGPPPAILAILELPAESRTPEQTQRIDKHVREQTDSPLRAADQALAESRKALEAFERTIPTAMVMRERTQPRETRVLLRGEYDKPGEVVGAGLPAVLPPLPEGQPLNRLGLAAWIVSRDHPLTARVWVNRAWERFFGTGIVRTSENFGSQAEYPTHPQLLDWLAAEFMEPTQLPAVNGRPPHPWDMQALQKLIVLSAAYRQTAAVPAAVRDRDPENRLLTRGPRFRLDGEQVRDQALAASGLLATTIGGPSVRPYMPEGVWDETSRYGDLRGYKPGAGPDLYRRTMYTIWKRTAAPPSLLLFDAPTRETCVVRRSRTNTPLQALSLLNETTYVEAARALAGRMATAAAASPHERLAYGFRLAVVRPPSPAELQVLEDGWHADLERFQRQPEAARKLLSVGAHPVPPQLDPAELAAYTLAANVILNLDEFITRE